MLHDLVIVNDGPAPLMNVVIRLSSEPAFLKEKIWRLDQINAQQDYHLRELDIALDPTLLGRLTEAESAQVVVCLERDGEELARTVTPIELLPRTQWGGIGHMPEMLAAFIQPNDPAVERVLKKSAGILRQNGRDGALNGYAGGPKRVWELTSAIWTAICGLGLDYALPPASFEHSGQKVRSPGQILDGRLATCLDSTLLFCSSLEQCGLNPVVIVTREHAFAGVWLKPEEFTQTVVDDITALRKRVKLGEMVLFETTLVTQRPSPAFSRATELGHQQISEAEEDKFELALDIRRARLQRIRPLASLEAGTVAPVETVEVVTEPTFEPAPDLPEDSVAPEDSKPATPQGRLDRWQRKLLDLSLRNSLLNFRPSKRVIRLDAPDPGGLEDRLAGGKKLSLLPRPELMLGADPRSQAIHEERHQEDVYRAHALDALSRHQVLANLPQDELETRLVDLYRQARSNLQEGGANTLFLALGFLKWTRRDKEETSYRAPLILLPVTLERKSVRSGFSLLLHEDEPRFNPTLIEMLRQDFKLTIPVAEGDLPKDDSGLDIGKIWRDVAHAVKDIKGWEVTEEVVLATFSFAKYLMWKDLVDRTEQLKKNPVVRHLIETPRDPYPGTQAFPDARALDHTHGPEHTFCPLPADSSQLSAVMGAAAGKDFVLVGPPGTGKSQTIANLIAQCLAQRKTVLFVSEKIAALDVVYRRLREVGLGEFCLELHSSKARKLDVLDQLRRSWEAKGAGDVEEWRREAQRLKGLRDQLNTFVEHLHRRRRNGLSAFLAMGRVISSKALPKLGLSWPSADAHDVDALDHLRSVAERLDINASAVGSIVDHPLAVVAHAEWSPRWQETLLTAARALISLAEALETQGTEFCQAVGLPKPLLDQRRRDALADLAQILPTPAGYDWRFVFRPDMRAVAGELQRGLSLLARYRATMAELSEPWNADMAAGVRRGLELAAGHNWQFLFRPDMQGLAEKLRRGLSLLAQYRATMAELSEPWHTDVAAGVRRCLELATEHNWQFAYRPDMRVLAEKLRRGLSLLARYRATMAELSEPWRTDVVASVRRGLELIARHHTLTSQLSVAYGMALKAADVRQLKADWDKAARDFVLTGWFGKRRVVRALAQLANGQAPSDPAGDLEKLVALRELEDNLAALEHLRGIIGAEWAGLSTDVDALASALLFQHALAASRSNQAWSEDGLSLVAGGHCGQLMATDLSNMRVLRTLAADISALDDLSAITGGLWAGLLTRSEDVEAAFHFHVELIEVLRRLRDSLMPLDHLRRMTDAEWACLSTDVDALAAALLFQDALAAARSNQAWSENGLSSVADGRCGQVMATDLSNMRVLRALAADIAALEDLWAKTGGVWAGLRTRFEDAEMALNVHVELAEVLRRLGGSLTALDHLRGITGAEWAGLSTDMDALAAALLFQDALAAARSNQAWSEDGLSLVAGGRCGHAMVTDLANMRGLRALAADIAALDDLSAKTGGVWAGLRTKSEDAEAALRFHAALAEAMGGLARTADELAVIRPALERLIGDGNALLTAGGTVAQAGEAYRHSLVRFTQAERDVVASLGSQPQAETPSAWGAVCQSLLPLESRLNAWCAWRKVRSEAISLGLAGLVQGIEIGAVAPGRVVDCFEADYASWWLNATVDGDGVLRSFVSAEHESRIAAFRALDDRFTDLTRQYIRANLCAGLPELDDVSRGSEWGVLRHEINKKRMHLPLRTLMGKIPTALPRLAPCLLMSPLSIAQYLPAETALFDVVVFDEASQIAVWDAIGAIARGRQVVMVGDPKQMPPSNFFERSQEDADDDVEMDGDLESILDECLGANLPTRHLTWHYRSRYESLIAFSNHRYYGGGLVTFPSPVTEDHAVSFHLVKDGVYEKGGARINKPEAKALVADLVGRLKDPAFAASGLTVGVVTFNSEQQKLIEDLLDEERRQDPALEQFFVEDLLEPVFVKNLENVQGDERDIMYFSITYGPDRTGAVSMNFGPITRGGGERRLNVAITRARHELRVFSSLHPDQLELSRTKAEGGKDLKHFMEFAERGPRALAQAVFGTIGDYDSPFEKAVADALAAKGWRVHPQVGVSSFRIDLGIVDQDVPGRYLAGVECDGATYHRSATARDRDKLREQVLRGLGWDIVRIWSTDWWVDMEGALATAHERLLTLQEKARAGRAEAAAREEAAARAAADAEAAMQESEETSQPVSDTGVVPAGEPSVSRRTADDLFQGRDFVLAPTLARRVTDYPAVLPAPQSLQNFDPLTAVPAVRPDAFFDPGYTSTLLAMMQAVIDAEAPVRGDVLARRIARAHGWAKTGSRILERVMAVAAGSFTLAIEGDHIFVWPQGADTSHCPHFRHFAGAIPRPVDEIALPELAALAREVKAEGHEGEAALMAMAKAVGLQKLSQKGRERLMLVLL
ncbi:hypothetical protein GCM10027396_10320 [Insolitispirillum peregrinum]